MSSNTRDTRAEAIEEPKRHSLLVGLFVRMVREKPLGTVGALIVLTLLLLGIFANFVAPYGYNDINLGVALKPPSADYILGTDNLGRDVLSRVIFGARISMLVGVIAAGLGTVISTIIGVISGFLGGKVDLIVQRFVDAWMTFPGLVILLTAMSLLGPGLWQVIFVLGLVYGIGGSRIIRSAVISIKGNVYVEATQAIGASVIITLIRHILPNVMPPIIVLFTTRMAGVILDEAALSFLGFGIPAPMPSWGGMLSGTGRQYMLLSPWMVIWPGLALSIVVYGVNMFGDAVRDILDPRLRGGLGRYGLKKPKKRDEKPYLRLRSNKTAKKHVM